MSNAPGPNEQPAPRRTGWRRLLKPFIFVISGIFTLIVIAMGDDPSQQMGANKSSGRRNR